MVRKSSQKGSFDAQKGSQKGSLYHRLHSNLTKSESHVLHLITNDFLTVQKVAIIRNCGIRAVQKIVKNLKKKGYLNVVNRPTKKVRFFQSTSEPFDKKTNILKQKTNHEIRLHGQEFNIKIIYAPDGYLNKIGKIITIDENTIRLYKKSIEIYGTQSFYGDSVHKATARSMEYWSKFFIRLENELNCILIKPRYQNITIVNQHYAETNNELAGECEIKGDKIKVYTTEEGKLWFLIDNSFNLHEAETVGKTAKDDMQNTVSKFFNDLRDNNPPEISQIYSILSETIRQNKETATGLNLLIKSLNTQMQTSIDQTNFERPDYFG